MEAEPKNSQGDEENEAELHEGWKEERIDPGPTMTGEKRPGPTVLDGWGEGKKDEKEHSDLTSQGPTPIGAASLGPTWLGEVEEKIHVGWSRDEKKKEK